MLLEWLLVPALIATLGANLWLWRRSTKTELPATCLVEHIPNAVLTVDSVGIISFANKAACRLLGYDKGELVGLCVDELVPEQQRHHHPHWRKMFQQSRRARPMGQLNALAARHKSGRSVPVRIELTPHDQGGTEPFDIVVVLYPAIENEEILNQVQRDAGVGTWEWDIEKDTLSWSTSVYDMFGLDRNQFEASYDAYLQVVHPEDRAQVDKAIRLSQETARPYEIEYRIVRNGEIRHLLERNYLHKDADEHLQYMWGSVVDITDRRLAETELQLAEAVFKHCAEGILVFDAAQQLLRTNNALLEITGYERDEVEAICAADLFVDPDSSASLSLNALVSHSGPDDNEWRGELQLKLSNGEMIPVLASVSTIDSAHGAGEYVLVCSDIRDIKAQEELLRHQAMHDSLTGLPNRRLFAEHLSQAIAACKRNETRVGVVYIDLDGFKQVNDTYGHEAGDELLCSLGTTLKSLVRESDILARIGGDEFAVILPNCGDDQMLSDVLERVTREAATAYRDVNVTLSLGAVCYPDHGEDGTELLILADQIMYRAKNSGKNQFILARNI
ncbi:sensor domain-containing diguanylate cyclase [Marinobacterium lacunae]|nr:sensor domain-containing diguanylate cyclase [Marinobacterium lacunae]